MRQTALNSNLDKAYKNTIFRLIIPTIIFATILYLPKMIFHSQSSTINDYIYNVLGGCSFWFTSALAVSQLILLNSLRLRIKSLKSMTLLAIILACSLPVLKIMFPSPFPWYFKSGIAAVLLMIAGGWIYNLNTKFNIFRPISFLFVFAYIIVILVSEFHNFNYHYALMSVTVNLSGIILSSLGIISIFIISHYIRPYSFIQFIGEHSIVFYFLSGAIPAALATLFKEFYGSTWSALLVGCIAILCGYGVTQFITKYMPYLTDIRLLPKLRL